MENNPESKLKKILVETYKYPSSQVVINPQLSLTPSSQKAYLDIAVYSCGVMIQAFEIKTTVSRQNDLTNTIKRLHQTLGGEMINVPIYGIIFQDNSIKVYNESGNEVDGSEVLNYENAKSKIIKIVNKKLNTDLPKSIKYPIYTCAIAGFLFALVMSICITKKCQPNCCEIFRSISDFVIFDIILWLLPTLLALPMKYLKIKFGQFEFSMILNDKIIN